MVPLAWDVRGLFDRSNARPPILTDPPGCDPGLMDEPDHATRIVLARLQGVVMRHARWEPLGEEEMAAAVAEVDEVLDGRADGPELLAYVAGILTGSRFGHPDELAQAVIAGSVCVAAGADEFAVDGWCCVGAERRAQADQLPGTARVL
jgi:hypothetical protein